jgi:hypothetical protein
LCQSLSPCRWQQWLSGSGCLCIRRTSCQKDHKLELTQVCWFKPRIGKVISSVEHIGRHLMEGVFLLSANLRKFRKMSQTTQACLALDHHLCPLYRRSDLLLCKKASAPAGTGVLVACGGLSSNRTIIHVWTVRRGPVANWFRFFSRPVSVFLTEKYDVPYNYAWAFDKSALEGLAHRLKVSISLHWTRSPLRYSTSDKVCWRGEKSGFKRR